MIYFLYEKLSGRIYSATTLMPENLSPEYSVVPSELPITAGSDYYVDNGSVVLLPPRPGDSFVFDYATKQWVDTRTNETQWAVVRADRNQRLQVTDWTQLADIPAQTKSLWEPYRQELRDVTSQSDPFNIVWPTPPQ